MITENGHGTGAIKIPPVKNIPIISSIGGDSAPFDWNIGYDILDTFHYKAGISEIPVKNQGTSSSCGGQASAYLIEVLDAIRDKSFVEKSARFIYAPCAVKGGGSNESSLINRELTVGSADESLVPSRTSGIDCDESFMTDTSDIDSNAIQNALQDKGLQAVYLDPTDIDSLAKCIRDIGGFVMGLDGENNGTWLSADPKPPTKREWGHWVYFGKARIRNGRKMIAFKNSWGPIGEFNTGWQWIDEKYLNGHTWGAWSFILINPPKITYTFNLTLKLGDSSNDVSRLQTKLKELGFFPPTQAITNYFGSITKQSVIAFQNKYGITPTGTVGPITRKKLNSL